MPTRFQVNTTPESAFIENSNNLSPMLMRSSNKLTLDTNKPQKKLGDINSGKLNEIITKELISTLQK